VGTEIQCELIAGQTYLSGEGIGHHVLDSGDYFDLFLGVGTRA